MLYDAFNCLPLSCLLLFAASRLFQFWNGLTPTRAPTAAMLSQLPIWSSVVRKGRKAKEQTNWYNRCGTTTVSATFSDTKPRRPKPSSALKLTTWVHFGSLRKLQSCFMLADLAASESSKRTDARYKRLEESKFINLSLSALGNCVAALAKVCTPSTHRSL